MALATPFPWILPSALGVVTSSTCNTCCATPGVFRDLKSGNSPAEGTQRNALKIIETLFDANRLKLIQERNLTSHELAVLTAAAVSPARYFVMMKGNPEERSKIPN